MRERRAAAQQIRAKYPLWLEISLVAALLFAILSLYIASLHLGLQFMDDVDAAGAADTNDGVYFGIHGLWIVAATVLGTVTGSWLRRSAFGFAALFVAVLVIAMVSAQIATFHLACEGHNDIIRHWQC